MAYKILNSEAVSVFPISNVRRYSDESVDKRARAISEYNLTNLVSSIGRNDFVKSIELKDNIYDIEFVLHGYYFRIALEKDKISSYQDIYAMIKLYVPSENPITYSIGKDIKNSSTNEYQFNGLYITNSNNEIIEPEDNTIDIKANYVQYYLKLLSLSNNNIEFNSSISDYKNHKYLYNYFDHIATPPVINTKRK